MPSDVAQKVAEHSLSLCDVDDLELVRTELLVASDGTQRTVATEMARLDAEERAGMGPVGRLRAGEPFRIRSTRGVEEGPELLGPFQGRQGVLGLPPGERLGGAVRGSAAPEGRRAGADGVRPGGVKEGVRRGPAAVQREPRRRHGGEGGGEAAELPSQVQVRGAQAEPALLRFRRQLGTRGRPDPQAVPRVDLVDQGRDAHVLRTPRGRVEGARPDLARARPTGRLGGVHLRDPPDTRLDIQQGRPGPVQPEHDRDAPEEGSVVRRPSAEEEDREAGPGDGPGDRRGGPRTRREGVGEGAGEADGTEGVDRGLDPRRGDGVDRRSEKDRSLRREGAGAGGRTKQGAEGTGRGRGDADILDLGL
ncbi:hypothetical protein THAOC_04389 [Thalassiosira oceanica]|uniref:Uncharacterized protein n=1 Tax=Thalassiosira oceanica TaxID=159749 RepID=K0TJ83_THAOC|nr:hypothetical protein THAOC_04389 [Thalassiosira oceanica]|eukprot:EJK73966.1 hypothetical protein THAOC_04389 [Thalassiosira oceanica]